MGTSLWWYVTIFCCTCALHLHDTSRNTGLFPTDYGVLLWKRDPHSLEMLRIQLHVGKSPDWFTHMCIFSAKYIGLFLQKITHQTQGFVCGIWVFFLGKSPILEVVISRRATVRDSRLGFEWLNWVFATQDRKKTSSGNGAVGLFCKRALISEAAYHCVAVCCSVWQYVAVCCSVLQCVVACCSVLRCVAVRSGSFAKEHWCFRQPITVLQYVAMCGSVLQRVAVCCSSFAREAHTLQHAATRCNALQHAATRCNTLQHTDGLPEICLLVCKRALPNYGALSKEIHPSGPTGLHVVADHIGMI